MNTIAAEDNNIQEHLTKLKYCWDQLDERRQKRKWKNLQRCHAQLVCSFAHCVYPIVLSNPFTSTKNRRGHFSSLFTIYRTAYCALKGGKENRGMETGKRGRNAHGSLRPISTPCNGPFKRPVSAKSASSLHASSWPLRRKLRYGIRRAQL